MTKSYRLILKPPPTPFDNIRHLFPSGIPIKAPHPTCIGGDDKMPCFEADTERLTSEQIEHLADALCEKWGSEITHQEAMAVVKRGVPIAHYLAERIEEDRPSSLPGWLKPHPDDRRFAGDEPVGDCLCSRCLQPIGDREVPIWFWTENQKWAWRYHDKCLGIQSFSDEDDDDDWLEGFGNEVVEATEPNETQDDWFDWGDEPEAVVEEPDEEFRNAFENLSQDQQPIHLQLAKYQGWCLLSSVQLAAVHPSGEDSPSVNVAVKIARWVEKLIVADSPRFALVARAGWNREEPPVALEELQAVMAERGNDIIELRIRKVEAWCLIATIQLAFRHPEFKQSSHMQVAQSIAMQLQQAFATEGILAIALNAGWDTRFDRS